MRFNLSDWALKHRSFVWFLMAISMVAGAMSYMNLGREEDPAFTIKTMVISASMPGATTQDMLDQVTTRIEDKLEELDSLDFTRSETMPGISVVYLDLAPSTPAAEVEPTWLRVREMMADIRGDFPAEFQGMVFNDNFGDVFGSVYAFTGPDYHPREMHDYVKAVRDAVMRLPDAGKVQIIGAQEQRVFIEFETRRLAALGLNAQQVLATLADQNAIVSAGVVRTPEEQIAVSMAGRFGDAADLAAVPLRVGAVSFMLSDVASVSEGYADPRENAFRFDGADSIGLAIGMREGANILTFGAELDRVMAEQAALLPLGVTMERVADQPHVVDHAVNHFVQALVEAVVIVLAVSFVSLGLRAGLVVTMTIPLVLALTFVILDLMGVTLQRISLGALIIALGLLVDDAMIAIETMISRLEAGDSRVKAASYAWTSIAFPMLSGTLVTVAGFIPIGFNTSMAGEYTISLFYVIAVSLVLSWVVAVLFAPLLGATFLPKTMKHHNSEPGRLRRMFQQALRASMSYKWTTIAVTLLLFAASVLGMAKVEQQFFPSSDRTELVIDVTLPQTSPITATDRVIGDLEAFLATRAEVSFTTSYVGMPAPRFILTHDAPTPTPYMGQVIVQTPDLAARDSLRAALGDYAATIAGAEIYTKLLEVGPPVGKPIQYRVIGPDHATNITIARDLARLLGEDGRLSYIDIDSSEYMRVMRVTIDYDQLRLSGLTQSDVANALASLTYGAQATALQDGEHLIPVIARGALQDRQSLETLQSMQLATPDGALVPLAALASFTWEQQPPVMHQRDRLPTVTVKAAVASNDQPPTIAAGLAPVMADFAKTLPAGYRIEEAGIVETTTDSQGPIIAVVPVMIIIMLVLIMAQLQSFRMTFVAFAVAPLALIGVVGALLLFGAPLGFVAILGVLALIGILIRNSVILLHEVQVLIDKGRSRWDAVFEAGDSRARPILLTAAAASLALIPIARQIFWGPMAIAMMGGIIVGTLITLLFAPALYCAVYRVKRPEGVPPEAQPEGSPQ